MYKKTHKFMQAGADRAMTANSLPYDPQLTSEQNRENLVSIKKKIEAEYLALSKKDPYRKNLGRQLCDINLKINALRPARKTSREVVDFFLDATKEIAGLAMYKIIMDRAVKLMEQTHNEYTSVKDKD